MDVHIIRYGHYKKEHYRNELSLCDFAVFISERETQGIALAEAWAMNVTTFYWDSFSAVLGGLVLLPTSSCPYLTKKTGCRWRNVQELRNLIYIYDRKYFSPREWVLKNMTDEVSARRLMEIFNKIDIID